MERTRLTRETSTPPGKADYGARRYSGKAVVFAGPMMSGKTTELIRQFQMCRDAKRESCLAINHTSDMRHGTSASSIDTHGSMSIPALQTTRLLHPEVCAQVATTRNIFINEGQFFEDLGPAVEAWVRDGKHVYVAMLNLDHTRTQWPQFLAMLPIARIHHMTTFCSRCVSATENALFTFKTGGNVGCQTEVGGANKYAPMCRECYETALAARDGHASFNAPWPPKNPCMKK